MAVGNTVARIFSEFLGSFFLMFAAGMTVLGGLGGFAAVAIAACYMITTYVFIPVSGAHFAPNVTLGSLCAGKIPVADAAIYVIAQIAGATGASFLASHMNGGRYSQLEPGYGYTGTQASIFEGLFGMFVVFVHLALVPKLGEKADSSKPYGLAVALAYIAGAYATGPISGGAILSNLTFGVDINSWRAGVFWCGPYIGAHMVGSILAAIVHRMVFPAQYNGCSTDTFQKGTAEFIGTFFLTLTAATAVAVGSKQAAFAIAGSLAAMISAVGSVSGAHLNLAVTLGIIAGGRSSALSGLSAIVYVIAQLGGAVVAGFVVAGSLGFSAEVKPTTTIDGKATWYLVGLNEALFTSFLVFTVLGVATVKEGVSSHIAPLCIGFCVIVGGLACTHSGGVLNPDVTFGLQLANSALHGGKFVTVLPYIMAQCAGAILSAILFHVTHSHEFGPNSFVKSA